jgi:hypothetical protein
MDMYHIKPGIYILRVDKYDHVIDQTKKTLIFHLQIVLAPPEQINPRHRIWEVSIHNMHWIHMFANALLLPVEFSDEEKKAPLKVLTTSLAKELRTLIGCVVSETHVQRYGRGYTIIAPHDGPTVPVSRKKARCLRWFNPKETLESLLPALHPAAADTWAQARTGSMEARAVFDDMIASICDE